MRIWILCAFATVNFATVAGCAGARGSVAFNKLEYPVSTSEYIYGRNKEPLSAKDVRVVGRVEHKQKMWGIVWSWIRLTGTEDISDEINEQVRRAGGDGVMNVTVEVDECGMNRVPIVTLFPFYPGCVHVSVTGNIVKQEQDTPAPGAAKTASASARGPGVNQSTQTVNLDKKTAAPASVPAAGPAAGPAAVLAGAPAKATSPEPTATQHLDDADQPLPTVSALQAGNGV